MFLANAMARLAEVAVPQVDASESVESIKVILGSIFSVDNLKTVIVGALSICAGLFIFWFAYRFIKGKVTKALMRGKI